MMTNTIVFDPLYIAHILTGKITATIRLWHLSRVTPNDTVLFVDAYQRKPFAVAKISLIETKRFSEFSDDDRDATQVFENFEDFSKIMESFYGQLVTEETEFRIIHFRLIDDGQEEAIRKQQQAMTESDQEQEETSPQQKRKK